VQPQEEDSGALKEENKNLQRENQKKEHPHLT
jgi:hypothetical protein